MSDYSAKGKTLLSELESQTPIESGKAGPQPVYNVAKLFVNETDDSQIDRAIAYLKDNAGTIPGAEYISKANDAQRRTLAKAWIDDQLRPKIEPVSNLKRSMNKAQAYGNFLDKMLPFEKQIEGDGLNNLLKNPVELGKFITNMRTSVQEDWDYLNDDRNFWGIDNLGFGAFSQYTLQAKRSAAGLVGSSASAVLGLASAFLSKGKTVNWGMFLGGAALGVAGQAFTNKDTRNFAILSSIVETYDQLKGLSKFAGKELTDEQISRMAINVVNSQEAQAMAFSVGSTALSSVVGAKVTMGILGKKVTDPSLTKKVFAAIAGGAGLSSIIGTAQSITGDIADRAILLEDIKREFENSPIEIHAKDIEEIAYADLLHRQEDFGAELNRLYDTKTGAMKDENAQPNLRSENKRSTNTHKILDETSITEDWIKQSKSMKDALLETMKLDAFGNYGNGAASLIPVAKEFTKKVEQGYFTDNMIDYGVQAMLDNPNVRVIRKDKDGLVLKFAGSDLEIKVPKAGANNIAERMVTNLFGMEQNPQLARDRAKELTDKAEKLTNEISKSDNPVEIMLKTNSVKDLYNQAQGLTGYADKLDLLDSESITKHAMAFATSAVASLPFDVVIPAAQHKIKQNTTVKNNNVIKENGAPAEQTSSGANADAEIQDSAAQKIRSVISAVTSSDSELMYQVKTALENGQSHPLIDTLGKDQVDAFKKSIGKNGEISKNMLPVLAEIIVKTKAQSEKVVGDIYNKFKLEGLKSNNPADLKYVKTVSKTLFPNDESAQHELEGLLYSNSLNEKTFYQLNKKYNSNDKFQAVRDLDEVIESVREQTAAKIDFTTEAGKAQIGEDIPDSIFKKVLVGEKDFDADIEANKRILGEAKAKYADRNKMTPEESGALKTQIKDLESRIKSTEKEKKMAQSKSSFTKEESVDSINKIEKLLNNKASTKGKSLTDIADLAFYHNRNLQEKTDDENFAANGLPNPEGSGYTIRKMANEALRVIDSQSPNPSIDDFFAALDERVMNVKLGREIKANSQVVEKLKEAVQSAKDGQEKKDIIEGLLTTYDNGKFGDIDNWRKIASLQNKYDVQTEKAKQRRNEMREAEATAQKEIEKLNAQLEALGVTDADHVRKQRDKIEKVFAQYDKLLAEGKAKNTPIDFSPFDLAKTFEVDNLLKKEYRQTHFDREASYIEHTKWAKKRNIDYSTPEALEKSLAGKTRPSRAAIMRTLHNDISAIPFDQKEQYAKTILEFNGNGIRIKKPEIEKDANGNPVPPKGKVIMSTNRGLSHLDDQIPVYYLMSKTRSVTEQDILLRALLPWMESKLNEGHTVHIPLSTSATGKTIRKALIGDFAPGKLKREVSINVIRWKDKFDSAAIHARRMSFSEAMIEDDTILGAVLDIVHKQPGAGPAEEAIQGLNINIYEEVDHTGQTFKTWGHRREGEIHKEVKENIYKEMVGGASKETIEGYRKEIDANKKMTEEQAAEGFLSKLIANGLATEDDLKNMTYEEKSGKVRDFLTTLSRDVSYLDPRSYMTSMFEDQYYGNQNEVRLEKIAKVKALFHDAIDESNFRKSIFASYIDKGVKDIDAHGEALGFFKNREADAADDKMKDVTKRFTFRKAYSLAFYMNKLKSSAFLKDVDAYKKLDQEIKDTPELGEMYSKLSGEIDKVTANITGTMKYLEDELMDNPYATSIISQVNDPVISLMFEGSKNNSGGEDWHVTDKKRKLDFSMITNVVENIMNHGKKNKDVTWDNGEQNTAKRGRFNTKHGSGIHDILITSFEKINGAIMFYNIIEAGRHMVARDGAPIIAIGTKNKNMSDYSQTYANLRTLVPVPLEMTYEDIATPTIDTKTTHAVLYDSNLQEVDDLRLATHWSQGIDKPIHPIPPTIKPEKSQASSEVKFVSVDKQPLEKVFIGGVEYAVVDSPILIHNDTGRTSKMAKILDKHYGKERGWVVDTVKWLADVSTNVKIAQLGATLFHKINLHQGAWSALRQFESDSTKEAVAKWITPIAVKQGYKEFQNLKDNIAMGAYGTQDQAILQELIKYSPMQSNVRNTSRISGNRAITKSVMGVKASELYAGMTDWVNQMTNDTFGRTTTGLKTFVGINTVKREIKKSLDAGVEPDIQQITRDVGMNINANLGGMDFDRLGVGRVGAAWLRLLFFAPDWSLSNITQFVTTFSTSLAKRTLGGKDFDHGSIQKILDKKKALSNMEMNFFSEVPSGTQEKMAASFMARAYLKGIVLSQISNALLSAATGQLEEQYSLDNLKRKFIDPLAHGNFGYAVNNLAKIDFSPIVRLMQTATGEISDKSQGYQLSLINAIQREPEVVFNSIGKIITGIAYGIAGDNDMAEKMFKGVHRPLLEYFSGKTSYIGSSFVNMAKGRNYQGKQYGFAEAAENFAALFEEEGVAVLTDAHKVLTVGDPTKGDPFAGMLATLLTFTPAQLESMFNLTDGKHDKAKTIVGDVLGVPLTSIPLDTSKPDYRALR